MPNRIVLTAESVEQVFAALAVPLLRAGVLTPSDWRPATPAPSDMIATAWDRWGATLRRDAPDVLSLHLVVQPWAAVLRSLDEDEEPTARDHQRLAVILDSSVCRMIAMEAAVHAWGREGAATAMYALRRGLGTVAHVATPGELDWVAEWWVERADIFEDREDRDLAHEQLSTFMIAKDEINEIARLAPRTPDAVRSGLQSLPAGPVRRAAAALLSRRRPTFTGHALDHVASASETGRASAAVLLTWRANDGVVDAYHEQHDDAMNTGMWFPPHSVLLLDTSTPPRLAAGLRNLRRMLRTMAHAEHLTRAMTELNEATP